MVDESNNLLIHQVEEQFNILYGMRKAYEYFYSAGDNREYKDIFDYFDADKDEKLSPIELINLFDAVRREKRNTGYWMHEYIGHQNRDVCSYEPLSLAKFVQVIDAQEPIFNLTMHLAIRCQTYKQPRKDDMDLGSVPLAQALNVTIEFRGGPCADMAVEELKALVDRNPDASEREAEIICFEHLVEGVYALCEAEKAKFDQQRDSN